LNRPPEEFVPVPPAALRTFTGTVFQRAGMPPPQAELLSELLVANDLRGVFSHGTRQATAYVGHFRGGRLNPQPAPRVTEEGPTTLTVDGDGGLGYFPAHQAATLLAPKAQAMGVAVALTRNHGHIGAAGIYSRILLASDLFGYVTSGHQLSLKPEQSVLAAAGGSPMSFALPTGQEPPFVLDFGAVHDLYPGSTHVESIIALAPGTVFRSLGLGCVCQALGGFLAGVPVDPTRAERQWPGADQGSFMIAVDLARFGPLEAFKQEMDEYARRVREMRPLAGFDQAFLAGGLEHEREAAYARDGVPVGRQHAEGLRALAAEFDVPAPL
jgi:L-2-hydroxycarboxylate dehydrogenase (NAD+)